MKLRILNNSIRLRLSQTEMEQMKGEGFCESTLHFPGHKQLTYRLGSGDETKAEFKTNTVLITLPRMDVSNWVDTNQVGISKELTLENDDKLSILVEKDFQCLTARGEDERDLFPNPKESH